MREGQNETNQEKRGVREREEKTERQKQKKMERSGKLSIQCGFDFNCQSSVISENQSHMS